MTCNCTCANFHKSTNITANQTNLIITATNTTQALSNGTPFCLVLCQSLSNLADLPAVVTINGTNYQLYDHDGVVLKTSTLKTRKKMIGKFVVNGSSSYIIFYNVPNWGFKC